MKISPIPSAITPVIDPSGIPQQSRVDALRSIKMSTTATPLQNHMSQQIPIFNDNETTVPVEATQPLSPQLALLAKQKRALQVKERELSNRERALSQSPTGGAALDIARLKSEPLRVLLENGVTYEQLAESIIAGQDGNSEINDLKAKLAALEQGIDQKFLDKDTAAEKQVLAEMQREALQLIAANDEYELVRETKSVPKVMKLIERTYKENGEVLEVSEALKLVEDELFKETQKLTRLKKLQNLMSPMNPQVQPQLRHQGMRTLMNRDTASVPLSAKARAMAAFYGTLKR